jgi:hypothetical protein
MSRLATWLARLTWFWIIQWMRRPWMRRAHLAPLKWIHNESKRARFMQSYLKQNRLARKIGLPLLKTVYVVFFACFALQIAYSVAIKMNEQGWFNPPQLDEHRIKRGSE